MFIAPTVGVRFWNLSLSVTGNGRSDFIFVATRRSLRRISMSILEGEGFLYAIRLKANADSPASVLLIY